MTLNRSLKISVIAHVALILAFLVKSMIFQGDTTPYIPALRVDLVGLPDVLKKDLDQYKNLPATKELKTQTVKETAPQSTATESESESESDMVLHPKKTNPAKEKKLKSKAKKALDRVKALSKLADIEAEETGPAQAAVKGNKISKGSVLTGEARETLEQSYYDDVLARLQEHWALPTWLARQDFSAKVLILIDARGEVNTLKFIKSSGNPQFDDAVRRAIGASQPFNQPPDALQDTLFHKGVLLGFPL